MKGEKRQGRVCRIMPYCIQKAGINYPAMQQGQPMRSGCAPAEPYPHGCNKRVAQKSKSYTKKGIANKPDRKAKFKRVTMP